MFALSIALAEGDRDRRFDAVEEFAPNPSPAVRGDGQLAHLVTVSLYVTPTLVPPALPLAIPLKWIIWGPGESG
jgi:hypothetical protein